MKATLWLSGLLTALMVACAEPAPVSHRAFRQSHPYSIGQTTLELFDTTRGRPLKTEIWYPTASAPGAPPSANTAKTLLFSY